jgi:hypothetical protein
LQAVPLPIHSFEKIPVSMMLPFSITPLRLGTLGTIFIVKGLASLAQQDFLGAGFANPFHQNLVEIAKDEATHVQFLITTLQGALAFAGEWIAGYHF